MNRILCTIFFSIVGLNIGNAQSARLTVQISKEWLQPGDTLEFAATYEKGGAKLPPATLAVVLQQNDSAAKWQMRWPMIDGEAIGAIIFPAGMPSGKYTLYTAVQPRFFRVYGRVYDPPGLKELDLRIADVAGGKAEMTVPVEKNGGFIVKDLLFESQAALVFTSKGRKQPVFSLEAWLDSAYTPVAATAKELGVGIPANSVAFNKISPDSARAKAATFADPFYNYKRLEGSGLSPIQKFDSLYSSAVFKKGVDTIFNCLENGELVKARDIDEFLKKALPGFDEANFDNFPVSARINNNRYVLYLNEQLLYASMLTDLSLADIAMIKIFKPNFKPSAKVPDNKGGIVIYTRRGPFTQENIYNPLRYLTGYQPEFYHLPLKPVSQ
jgi:hypothetical protein